MTRPSVLHLVPVFGYGGRERVIIDTIQGMQGSRAGVVGTSGGAGVVDLEKHGIRWLAVPWLPSTPWNVGRSFAALIRIVRTQSIGILHSHHRYAGVVGRMVAASAGIPFVSTVHDLAGERRRVSRFSVGSTVMVFSDAVERHVIEHFGVPRSSVHRVPMGLSVPEASASTASRPQVVGFFGRLEWEKGPDLFLEAAANIVRECPDAEFWIGGAGALEAPMRQLSERLGLGGKVRFLGWLSDIDAAVRATSVVVVPSRREGFGLAVLEAMMRGKPVVAARVGGIPELIEDGHTGCTVPAGNVPALAEATLALLRDPILAERIGSAARASACRTHSTAAMVAAVERLYRQVTS